MYACCGIHKGYYVFKKTGITCWYKNFLVQIKCFIGILDIVRKNLHALLEMYIFNYPYPTPPCLTSIYLYTCICISIYSSTLSIILEHLIIQLRTSNKSFRLCFKYRLLHLSRLSCLPPLEFGGSRTGRRYWRLRLVKFKFIVARRR